MSYLPCITNSINDIRSCVKRDEHLTGCDGFEHRWMIRDIGGVEVGSMEVTEKECSGCLPLPAHVGLLCMTCWEQLDATFARKDDSPVMEAVDLTTHLHSIEKSQSANDGIRSAPGSRVIIPPSWIGADELMKSLVGIATQYAADWNEARPDLGPSISPVTGFYSTATYDDVARDTADLAGHIMARLDRLVTKHGGATEAVRWVRTFQRADRQFERQEKPRPIRWVKCRECGGNTLEYKPPLQLNEPRLVKCRNLSCRAEWDPAMIEFDLRLIREELEQPISADDYPRTVAEMRAHSIDPANVPVHTLDQHGYQVIYRKGQYAGTYGAHTRWPDGCNAWPRFVEERDLLAAQPRLDIAS